MVCVLLFPAFVFPLRCRLLRHGYKRPDPTLRCHRHESANDVSNVNI